jgi:hypothetical protein
MMQLEYKANGINFSVQTRTLNWREIDARAEGIVNDPSKRPTEQQVARRMRDMGCLDDPKPRKKRVRRYVRSR